jgi:hypothetical protein
MKKLTKREIEHCRILELLEHLLATRASNTWLGLKGPAALRWVKARAGLK